MFTRVLDHSRFHIPFLLGVCLLLYFPFLGARDFWDQENMYAEVTRMMLLGKSWALPQMNGELWLENPPLFFWLAFFFSRLAGEVNEWTIRLIPALSATFLVGVVYHFLQKRFAPRIAFLSSLVLATFLLTVHVERHVPINMIFFLFVVISMFLLMEILVFDSLRPSHAYGVWFFMALACLTKGPIAIVLPGLVTGAYVAVSGCWKRVSALRPFTGSLLFLGMTMPWYVFAKWQVADDWTSAFVSAHAHLGGGHSPFYDYVGQFPGSALYSVANFPLDFMPWTFLFLPAVIDLWREKDRVRRGAPLFLSLWFGGVFLFPHLSVVEHSHYLFLLSVPTALIVAIHLDRILAEAVDEKAHRRTRRFVSVFCYLIVILGIALPLVAAVQGPELILQNLAVGLAGLIGAMGLLYELKRRNYPALAFGFAALMIVINLLVQGLVLPPVNALEVRPFAESLHGVVKPDSVIGVYLTQQPPFREFNFYSRVERFQILQDPAAAQKFLSLPGPRFILITRRRVNQIKKNSPAELKPLLTQGGDGLEWWFPASGRWVLFYSCNGGCESTAPPVEAKIHSASHH